MKNSIRNDVDIKYWLAQLEDGAISDDGCDSDGDDLDFYPTQKDLLAALEDDDGEVDNNQGDEPLLSLTKIPLYLQPAMQYQCSKL